MTASLPSMESQSSYRPPSVLQRTVTSLPTVTSLTRLESLANDSAKGAHREPVQLEARLGRTLENMLRTSPHLRSSDDIDEIEHALTKWSKYGLDLPTPSRLELCKYLGFAAFDAEDIIFKQGDFGDHFYIILSGAVDVLVRDGDTDEAEEKAVAHLLAGAAFGELALMQGQGQRRATCRCTQSTELFTVDIKDFQRILRPLQQGSLQFKMQVLRQVPQFQGLPVGTIESLAHVMTEKEYPPKSVIYYQGNEVEDFFIVQRGCVKMVRELEMGRKRQSLTGTTSSIPAWLVDNKTTGSAHSQALKPSSRSSRAALLTQPQVNGSPKGKAPPPPPSYHKLSLDVIKSLTGDRANSKADNRAAATGGSFPGSKSKSSPSQKINGQHKVKSAYSSPNSADAAIISKSIADGLGRRGVVDKAVDTAQPTSLTPRKRQTTFKFEDVKEHVSSPNAVSNNWLMSEATFTQRIMQQMSYTGSHQDQDHLFLEVDSLGKSELFGEVSITKSTRAPATAISSNVTATVLLISKWDLMKRAPTELVDHIISRAQASVIDDNAVRAQYKECKMWQRYRQSLVNDILQRHKAVKSNNPVNIWKGPFRDEAPIDREHKPWKPNGAAKLSSAVM